jgi:serine/threonine-protein kinase RsbW
MPKRNRIAHRYVSVEDLELRYEATIPADIGLTEHVVAEIMKVVEDSKCTLDKQFEVELALREALANAIRHGCRNDPCKEVSISVACAESFGILLVVRDPGEGFDPDCIPNPVIGENVFLDHGRGIFLISQIMDEVRFEKGGTEIHMVKRKKG